jgi:Tat protein translocase TatB subunit
MFNLGFSELLLLGVIALIFIGPNQLPELARTVGRLLNEFKRASSDFQDSFTEPIKDDLKNRIEESRALHKEPEPKVEVPAVPETPHSPREDGQS